MGLITHFTYRLLDLTPSYQVYTTGLPQLQNYHTNLSKKTLNTNRIIVHRYIKNNSNSFFLTKVVFYRSPGTL